MNKKILFVDDDANLLQSIERIIKTKFKDVTADFKNNADDVIKNIDNLNYNIVVTDFKMPGLDGQSLIKKIKKKYPEIISIILTGHIEEAIKSIADDPNTFYLEKPYAIDDLMQTIELAINAKL